VQTLGVLHAELARAEAMPASPRRDQLIRLFRNGVVRFEPSVAPLPTPTVPSPNLLPGFLMTLIPLLLLMLAPVRRVFS